MHLLFSIIDLIWIRRSFDTKLHDDIIETDQDPAYYDKKQQIY